MLRQNVKHVRFADQVTFYTPSVNTLFSPTTEAFAPRAARGNQGSCPKASTLRSNSNSLAHHSTCIQLHRYLEISAVDWNIWDPPSTIKRNDRSISGTMLCEPATNPPLAYIAISSPRLPWAIKVHASRLTYVTLEDVFNALYFSLRTNVTRAEFLSLLSQTDRQRAVRAYEWRYRRLHRTRFYQAEKFGGMKRVDFFMGRSCFLGLSNICCQPGEWLLNVTW